MATRSRASNSWRRLRQHNWKRRYQTYAGSVFYHIEFFFNINPLVEDVNQDDKQILSSFISRHPWRSKLRHRPWSHWQRHHSESVASALPLRKNQIRPSAKCICHLSMLTPSSLIPGLGLYARRVGTVKVELQQLQIWAAAAADLSCSCKGDMT